MKNEKQNKILTDLLSTCQLWDISWSDTPGTTCVSVWWSHTRWWLDSCTQYSLPWDKHSNGEQNNTGRQYHSKHTYTYTRVRLVPRWPYCWRRGGFSDILMGHVKSTSRPGVPPPIWFTDKLASLMPSVLTVSARHDPFQPILLQLKDDGKAALLQQHWGWEMDAEPNALHNVLQ